MYDPKSLHAEQFIDNDEVLASLEYADRYCNDPAEIDRIIEIFEIFVLFNVI